MATFETLYKRLNTGQKQAVDAIEGPVMVIAGPGTGKTQILTLRIANILKKTDTPADAILALTFTEAGVFAMRKRLVDIIGSRAYQVGIYTFHSFCNELIRAFPDQYPRIVGSTNVTDVDKFQILEAILLKTELARLKPFGDPLYYLKAIASAISELKREAILPQEAKKLAQKERESFEQLDDLYHEKGAHKGKMKGKYTDLLKKIEKNEELVRIFEAYEEALRHNRQYDYEDMIVETITALKKDKDFLLTLQEQYLYVLADEHQDANNSQNTLLELLSSFHDNPNLFLVGDAKQAIYRFQGASLENFLYFKERYPSAALIQLEQNYRSRQSILSASHSLIEQGALSAFELKKPLIASYDNANDGVQHNIRILEFARPETEMLGVAKEVKTLLDEGVPAQEIAVLYRTNSDAAKLVPAFEKLQVPFVLESDQNVLEDSEIKKLLMLMRAIVYFGNDELLTPILYLDVFALEPLDVYRLLWRRRESHKKLYTLMKNKGELTEAGIEHTAPFLELYKKLAGWSTLAKNQSKQAGLLFVLEKIVSESGLLAHTLEDERGREKLEKLAKFVRSAGEIVEVHREYSLEDFVKYLALLEAHNLSISFSGGKVAMPQVRLMTAHKAKGLEFDYVFIVRAFEGHWGSRRSVQHFTLLRGQTGDETGALDDERRLFYVALTRARSGVSISYSAMSVTNRPQLPTQFIEEIDEGLREHISMEQFEQSLDPAFLLTPAPPQTVSPLDKAYLNELFLTQGLSVTALNNYVKSPWEYFFGNLLRVPKSPDKHMLFGTAIHNALHDAFERVKAGEDASVEYLLEKFRAHAHRMPLSEHDYAEVLKKGEHALGAYFTRYASEFTPRLGNEWDIVVSFRINDSVVIPLRGKIDSVIDLGGNLVRVFDYKTGSIKSRNHIEGNTASSGGEYKRQLVFYALLLSLYEEGKYQMSEGVIDFVEPDKNGAFKREVFAIDQEEVEELKALIKKSAQEILALSFWDTSCDEQKCHYCNLQEALIGKK